MAAFYLIQFDGIFQTQDEVNNYKNSAGKIIEPYAKPGDVRYVDANDDGAIDNGDRVHMGNPIPEPYLWLQP